MFLFLSLFFFLFLQDLSLAQKPIIFTNNDPYVKATKGKEFFIALGYPAFANFYDFLPPEKIFIKTANGTVGLTLIRKELFDPWFNKPRIAYSTLINGTYGGDLLFCLESKNLLTDNKRITKHFTKMVIHADKEGGWDKECGFDLEILPFTRPYGLVVGGILWGQVLYLGQPVSEGMVSVERLRIKPLEKLPKASTEEPNLPIFIRTTKLKIDGTFIVNFEEEGWWVVSFSMPRGTATYGNQNYPFELSTHLWVYVFPKGEKKIEKKSRKRR